MSLHMSAGSSTVRSVVGILALIVALLGSGAYLTSLTQAATPATAVHMETNEPRPRDQVKNNVKELCEGEGGVYIDLELLDGTVICLIAGEKLTCKVWLLMLSDPDACSWEQVKPAVSDVPVRGSAPRKVAPGDPSLIRPMRDAQVAQPEETATTTDDKDNAVAQVVQANAQPTPTSTSTCLVVDCSICELSSEGDNHSLKGASS